MIFIVNCSMPIIKYYYTLFTYNSVHNCVVITMATLMEKLLLYTNNAP